MEIRRVAKSDASEWARLRRLLWPEDDHTTEVGRFFDQGGLPTVALVLLAIDDDGRTVGFAEGSIRPFAEGCYSGRVAFLEGWFVEARARRRGIGRALLAGVEDWGRVQGCTELGSDTQLHNDLSEAAHKALGFEEVERLIAFRKPLV